MKTPALMLLIATLLSGCMVMVPGHLYPIQGPLASQTPPPVLPLTLDGVFKSGTLTGTQGSTVNAEFYDPHPGNITAVVGIAQDSKGNLYKLTL